MKENNLGKTLLYALGEILLVVVGILIAVQIDHWNEGRKDRTREAFLIKEINREMKKNLELFDATGSRLRTISNAGDSLIRLFPLSERFFNNPKKKEKFDKFIRTFILVGSFDPSQGAIKSIINSGEIGIITNDTLRSLIVAWEDKIRDYKEEEKVAWDYGYQFLDWLSTNFPNPNEVTVDYSRIDYYAFQGKIVEKTSRVWYVGYGEDQEAFRNYLLEIIELTDN